MKFTELGEELSKDARASHETGGKAHPTLVHFEQYLALAPWNYNRKDATQPIQWPRAEDAPALRVLLLDKDSRLRARAAEALELLYDPEDLPFIAELLNDKADGPVALTGFAFYRAALVLKDEKTLALNVEWKVRPVSEHAKFVLARMTGEKFTPESFPAWWARNQNARECLWFWQQLLWRERRDLPAGKMFQEKQSVLNDWAAKMRQTIAALPPEVEAKILLVAKDFPGGCVDDRWHQSGIFDAELKLRISKERILALLEQKNVWPDVNLVGDDYNRLFERVMLSSETLFAANDSRELQRILMKQSGKMWWSGRAAGHIGISRLLAPAGKDLNDINSREGWLRAGIRSETDVFTRGYVARELIQIGLPANFDFIRDEFFKADTPNAIPNFSQSVLQALGSKPLTQVKRAALVDLLLDPRSEERWTRELRVMGDDSFQTYAIQSVNAFAGKELITYDEKQALRNKATSVPALKSILEKIRALGEE